MLVDQGNSNVDSHGGDRVMPEYRSLSPVEIHILDRDAGLAKATALLADASHPLILGEGSLLDRLDLRSFFPGRVLEEVSENPSIASVTRALAALDGSPVDHILAIGGGSCIDLAKAISALYGLGIPPKEEVVRRAIDEKIYQREHSFIDIVAMPTTAGTGSEVTRWATIWDTETERKLSIEHERIHPRAAIVIPYLTALMPPRLTLATGLDALSHAMEAFWAKARTPLSQALSLDAITRIRQALPLAVRNGEDIEAREAMSLGALLAGLSFSITRTTACHSISYPITMRYGVPHGLAVAMTLAPVMARNAQAIPEMARLEAVFSQDGGFSAWLAGVSEQVQSLTLKGLEIPSEDVAEIASGAFTLGRMDNNPVAFRVEDVAEILAGCV